MAAAAAPLTALPALGPPGWIALGVIGLGAAGYAGYKLYQSQADASADADKKAKELSEDATDETCRKCKDDPCAQLAKGAPGSKYRGGSHRMMTQPSGDGLQSHHTPAAAASNLPRSLGPAIQMDSTDHLRTASQSRQPGYLSYIASQKELVNSGNFMGAIGMDIADIHSKFGSKYDSALAQMSAYAACLKRTGAVK